jgi:hypothetical protein
MSVLNIYSLLTFFHRFPLLHPRTTSASSPSHPRLIFPWPSNPLLPSANPFQSFLLPCLPTLSAFFLRFHAPPLPSSFPAFLLSSVFLHPPPRSSSFGFLLYWPSPPFTFSSPVFLLFSTFSFPLPLPLPPSNFSNIFE